MGGFLTLPAKKNHLKTSLIAAQSQDNRIRLQSGSKQIDTIFEKDWIDFDINYLCFIEFFTHNR